MAPRRCAARRARRASRARSAHGARERGAQAVRRGARAALRRTRARVQADEASARELSQCARAGRGSGGVAPDARIRSGCQRALLRCSALRARGAGARGVSVRTRTARNTSRGAAAARCLAWAPRSSHSPRTWPATQPLSGPAETVSAPCHPPARRAARRPRDEAARGGAASQCGRGRHEGHSNVSKAASGTRSAGVALRPPRRRAHVRTLRCPGASASPSAPASAAAAAAACPRRAEGASATARGRSRMPPHGRSAARLLSEPAVSCMVRARLG